MCRRTRQIVAFVIGDRSAKTCRKLWNKLPAACQKCASFSDFRETYQEVFTSGKRQCVGQETGETAHIERWNNTFRQWMGRYTRETLSFSKADTYIT
jgi:insertion element IS1 protein InsB